ncbi:MAG: DUF11 domain-containing protein, partial [Comamonadaceae bacterium]
MASLFLILSLFANSLAQAQTQVTNIATITPPATVTNTNASGSCTVAGVCSASDTDLVTPARPTISKAFSVSSINAGGTALLTITLTNTHALVSATVSSVFTDVYPANLVNANSSPQTTCVPGTVAATTGLGTLTLAAGAVIPPGASCAISSVVTSAVGGTVTNTIPAGSLTTSVGSSSNTATAVLSVNASADLVVSKVATGPASAGKSVTYVVTLVNAGPSTAQNVTLTDTLSAGLSLNGSTPASNGSVTTSGTGTAVATVASLAPGSTLSMTVTALVTASTGNVTNTAVGTSTTPDPTPGNNTVSVPLPVIESADLLVTKTSTGPAIAGSTVTYVVKLVNAGPSTAQNVTLTDTLSAGLSLNGSTPASNGAVTTIGTGTAVATIATLTSGSTLSMTVTA